MTQDAHTTQAAGDGATAAATEGALSIAADLLVQQMTFLQEAHANNERLAETRIQTAEKIRDGAVAALQAVSIALGAFASQSDANHERVDPVLLRMAQAERDAAVTAMEAMREEIEEMRAEWALMEATVLNRAEHAARAELRARTAEMAAEEHARVAEQRLSDLQASKESDLQHQGIAFALSGVAVTLAREFATRPLADWPALIDPANYGPNDAYLIDAARVAKLRARFGDERAQAVVRSVARQLDTFRKAVADAKDSHMVRPADASAPRSGPIDWGFGQPSGPTGG